MSRNEKRVASNAQPPQPQPAVPTTTDKSEMHHPTSPSGINFVVPTEIVDIPSEGKLYAEGHPLHNARTIEIRYMTAKEEDILTSPTLIRNGKALTRMLKSILIDKRIDPDSLYAGDRNALLVAARITGFGPDYKTSYNCPRCGENSDQTFDLNDVKTRKVDDNLLETLEVTRNGNEFFFKLEKLNVEVGIAPLLQEEEEKITHSSKRKLELGLSESITTDTLRAIITSISGSRDESMINQIVDLMPVLDSRHVRKIYSLISPAVTFECDATCNSCRGESRLEVPFDTDFFWPRL